MSASRGATRKSVSLAAAESSRCKRFAADMTFFFSLLLLLPLLLFFLFFFSLSSDFFFLKKIGGEKGKGEQK